MLTVGVQNYGLPLVRDATSLGGPVGGVLAGASALRKAGHDRMLVLAVDAPTVRAKDILPLIAHDGPAAAFEGLHLPMVADLAALPSSAAANWPLARLLDLAGATRLACAPEARNRLRGANTPDERAVLLAALAEWENAQKGGAC